MRFHAIQNVEMKKRKMELALDKTRGFVKYGREKRMWRDPAKRTGDWNEIYDYKHIRTGLKKQAARYREF